LNWINRFIDRTGSAAVALGVMLCAAAVPVPASADSPLTASYQGRSIRFTHVASRSGETAVGVNDPGLQAILRDTGAFVTWKPGERYILITTSTPTVVSFALGDRRYDVGPIALQASIAPFLDGDEAYLPLREVLRSLDLALRQDNGVGVIQPQLAALDVQQDGARVTLLAHGAAALHARVAAEGSDAVTYVFDGVGTTLAGNRQVGVGGVRSVMISNSGTVREPMTLVTVTMEPGAVAEPPQNADGHDVVLAFDASPSAGPPNGPESVGPPPPPEEPPPAPISNAGALVSGVSVASASDGLAVTIAVSGNASYEWHRLRQPDNRFWIDIKNAQLQEAPFEQSEADPLSSMRVRQVDSATVRVALSLAGPKAIGIAPSATGVEITIGTQDVADEPRSGSGSIGSVVAAQQAGPAVTPAASDSSAIGDDSWKFGARSSYAPSNPRLIVIDPGHGGSDIGTMHGGVAEAQLTLDMAKRLRDILVERGWQVKMTRETDVDVYAPNDSAHDELQARDDVANRAGARLFISIHANAYINSGPYGTTCYISKPDDVALAHFVERHLASDGTKDDGVIKSHLYVTLHARMPAVLVEAAFLTNPGDYALLTSPTWRQKVAQEMADGIAQYARTYPVANQPAQ
jgi:N-acetylmuramoyl-L-alanine amidase